MTAPRHPLRVVPRLQAPRQHTITAREVDEWLATLPPVEPRQ